MKTEKTEKRFTPGDRVRLTGEFLRNTGMQLGQEGFSVWIVQECSCKLCSSGLFILTNEFRENDGLFTQEELDKEPFLRFRHINSKNLEIVP